MYQVKNRNKYILRGNVRRVEMLRGRNLVSPIFMEMSPTHVIRLCHETREWKGGTTVVRWLEKPPPPENL